MSCSSPVVANRSSSGFAPNLDASNFSFSFLADLASTARVWNTLHLTSIRQLLPVVHRNQYLPLLICQALFSNIPTSEFASLEILYIYLQPCYCQVQRSSHAIKYFLRKTKTELLQKFWSKKIKKKIIWEAVECGEFFLGENFFNFIFRSTNGVLCTKWPKISNSYMVRL